MKEFMELMKKHGLTPVDSGCGCCGEPYFFQNQSGEKIDFDDMVNEWWEDSSE